MFYDTYLVLKLNCSEKQNLPRFSERFLLIFTGIALLWIIFKNI